MEYVYQISRKVYVTYFQIVTLITLAICSGVAGAQSATNIQVSSAVQQSSVTRLGINLGDQDYYDSGQMVKNLVFDNPGFEPMVWRSILTCGSSTANTCVDNNQYSPEPAGFWTGGTYEVVSGASAGATGTIVSSAAVSSCYGCGQTITFDKNLSLAHNDNVIVRNTFPGNAQAGWWTSTSGGGTITTDTTDLSPETPGKQAVSMNAAGQGQSVNLTSWFDSMQNMSFIQLNGTFQVTFRAKATGGSNSMNVTVARLMAGLPSYINQTVTLTNAWKDYTLTFTAAETGSALGPVELSFTASGANVLLDDVALQQTNSDPTNTTAFRDDVVNALKSLKPGVIRMMASYAELGADIPDQLAVPFARYREGYNTGGTEVDSIPYGIHELLQLCAAVGADPWITIPTATTPQEMTDLVEYLTGNGSDPYSASRIARGQTAPWTSVFNKIHIELGNETWNGVFLGEYMTYPAYPDWANQVFGAARQTSGYEPSKFDLVLSGIAATPGYNSALLTYSTQHDSIDIAPYLLYSANNDTVNGLFQSLFAEPEMFNTSGGEVYKNMQAAATASTPTKVNVYEVNLGTVLGSITQTELNQLTPSVGAGVAVADHMLQMMGLGVSVQNMFALPQYEFGRTDGSMVKLWGTVVDMGTTNRKRPQFLAEQLANTAVFGDMLQTQQTGANPTWNEPLSSDNVQLNGAHEIQSFAFTNGTQSSVVLFNLTVGTSLPVTFSGPNAPTGTVQVGRLTSANITDNNETANNVQIVNSTLTGFNPSSQYVLPPYSMTVLTWGGGTETTTPTAAAPTFSQAAGSYTGSIPVAISDATSGAAIYYTTDGSTPTTSSAKYSSAITLSATTTLKAIAVASGYTNSAVSSVSYTITAATTSQSSPTATPAITPGTGNYGASQAVTISDTTSGATIYYTTDGSTPTTSSTVYKGSFTATVPGTIKAIAVAAGHTASTVASAVYSLEGIATPTFSPAGGTYTTGQKVTITDTTSGVTLYYTTNGTTPSASSTQYTGPITVGSSETIKAIAVYSVDPSSVATATYTIGSPSPTINYPNGFSAAKVNLNVSALFSGTALQLTKNTAGQIGTGWYTTPVSVSGFTTDFTFRDTNASGDGLTFTLQNAPKGLWAFGGNGSALGYQGITKSVAVKFDLENGSGTNPSTTGVYVNGASPVASSVDMSSAGINFHSGDIFKAHIVYSGTTLTLTVTDTVTAATFTKQFTVNIPSTVGANTAYAGFTGSTGARTATQQILSWTYTTN
ncbi:chitobiase/beta-hexosaminidase C-terminal domain-containing protein [Paracidobacterium acidisoli]|uniref:Uncharacterized protein n=1 Tax=Paracidobacterium acidisoli TaxID=2303751 RepID=A0A372IR75_9BACT|nr:chitobiase/beta-hexosaminidase C-terminal domain-containing protein [Paracidobacterium acidisoli]MBT9330247.1 chitobiase/beta-hexosaminidase C-terminal domain-containing protein [Paracidobacterium acidisoli]